ncbi:porphobilinogen synthase [soil metagenome]
MSEFPLSRPRRLRRTAPLRALFRETRLSPGQLVLPLFVRSGQKVRRDIASMPGIVQTSVDELLRDAEGAALVGVGGVLLFGIPDSKDATGTGAWDEDGAVQQAARALKTEFPQLVVMTDVCMCEYTDHGHCGVLRNGEVDNDATLELLARAAVSQAASGADVVAPSDMMDGRVLAIRGALDEADLGSTLVLSYAVKYASAFYGPFRDAAESAPRTGDRRAYQMDSGNSDEAIREVLTDIGEGADAVMVKPAGPCLDVISRVRREINFPLAAYQVSGEYAMMHAAAARGWLDLEKVMMESLLAIRRAGADVIVTYFAREAADLLAERGDRDPQPDHS